MPSTSAPSIPKMSRLQPTSGLLKACSVVNVFCVLLLQSAFSACSAACTQGCLSLGDIIGENSNSSGSLNEGAAADASQQESTFTLLTYSCLSSSRHPAGNGSSSNRWAPLIIQGWHSIVASPTSNNNEQQQASSSSPMYLCNLVQSIWMLPGSRLRLQGLALRQAVLPSKQLLAAGLAAPAPLALNLTAALNNSNGTGSSSSSGNNSNSTIQLLLEDCTVEAPSCANLAQFVAWVRDLLMDPGAPAGAGSGMGSSVRAAASGVQLAQDGASWAFLANLQWAGSPAGAVVIQLKNTNFTCNAGSSPAAGAATAAATAAAAGSESSSTSRGTRELQQVSPPSSPTAADVTDGDDDGYISATAEDPQQLLALLRLVGHLQPATIYLPRSMRIPTDWPGSSVSVSVSLVLMGPPAPAPRTVLDFYKVHNFMVLQMMGGSSSADITLQNLQLMNLCAVLFMPNAQTLPLVSYISSVLVWPISYPRSFLGLHIVNVTITIGTKEAQQYEGGRAAAQYGASDIFGRYEALGKEARLRLGILPDIPPLLQANTTAAILYRTVATALTYYNTTFARVDEMPDDEFDIQPLDWCRTPAADAIDFTSYGDYASTPQALAHLLANMTLAQVADPLAVRIANDNFPFSASLLADMAMAEVLRLAGEELSGAAGSSAFNVTGSSSSSSDGVTQRSATSAATSTTANTTTSQPAAGGSTSASNATAAPGVTIGMMLLLTGPLFPVELGGSTPLVTLDLRDCHGRLPITNPAAHVYLGNLKLTGLQPATVGSSSGTWEPAVYADGSSSCDGSISDCTPWQVVVDMAHGDLFAPAIALWAFRFPRVMSAAGGDEPRIHLYNVTLVLPAQEYQMLLTQLLPLQPKARVSSQQGASTAQPSLNAYTRAGAGKGRHRRLLGGPANAPQGTSLGKWSAQVLRASRQAIVLDQWQAWGVNGSLVTLLPDQPLPPTGDDSPPPTTASPAGGGSSGPLVPPGSAVADGSSGGGALSSGALAGVVVGAVVGCALLLAAAMVVWRRRNQGRSPQLPRGKEAHGGPESATPPADHQDDHHAAGPPPPGDDGGPGGSPSPIPAADPSSAGGPAVDTRVPLRQRSPAARPDAGGDSPGGSGNRRVGATATAASIDTCSRSQHATSASGGRSLHGSKTVDEVLQMMEDLGMTKGSNRLVIKERIGAGGYGTVHRGLWCNLDVAVKMMVFEGGEDGKGRKALALREAAVCSSLSHRNIVATYHFDVVEVQAPMVTEGASSGLTIADQHAGMHYKLYLIQELCDLNLQQLALGPLDQGGLYTPRGRPLLFFILPMLMDVVEGMAYLHKRSIVHGDLTLNNVLIKLPRAPSCLPASQHQGEQEGGEVMCKVADFGLCETLHPGQTHVSKHNRGTPFFTAPEVLLHHQVTKGSDVYAFGIIMWCMYHRSLPCILAPIAQSPCAGAHRPTRYVPHPDFPRFPASAPEDYTRLVHACLHFEPEQRPSFEEIAGLLAGLWAKSWADWRHDVMLMMAEKGESSADIYPEESWQPPEQPVHQQPAPQQAPQPPAHSSAATPGSPETPLCDVFESEQPSQPNGVDVAPGGFTHRTTSPRRCCEPTSDSSPPEAGGHNQTLPAANQRQGSDAHQAAPAALLESGGAAAGPTLADLPLKQHTGLSVPARPVAQDLSVPPLRLHGMTSADLPVAAPRMVAAIFASSKVRSIRLADIDSVDSDGLQPHSRSGSNRMLAVSKSILMSGLLQSGIQLASGEVTQQLISNVLKSAGLAPRQPTTVATAAGGGPCALGKVGMDRGLDRVLDQVKEA